MGDNLLSGLVVFGRTSVGLVFRPYETMRRVVDRGTKWELSGIVLLLAFYFALASLVKTAAFRPFLLTRHFVLLGAAAGFTTLAVAFLFWSLAAFVGRKGAFPSFGLAWSYTLMPTVLWFLMTSLLYVILPPPRTARPQGVAYSTLFLVCSVALLYWKVTLGYLALRFGMKLNLQKILFLVGMSLPLLALYSVMMYRLGVFRVPFF